MNKELLENINTVFNNFTKEVGILHANQQVIKTEMKVLSKEVSNLETESEKWINLYGNLNKSLRELGDLKNWCEFVEQKLDSIIE